MVQPVKNMLKKAQRSNGHPYIALLEYPNTPTVGVRFSPGENVQNAEDCRKETFGSKLWFCTKIRKKDSSLFVIQMEMSIAGIGSI